MVKVALLVWAILLSSLAVADEQSEALSVVNSTNDTYGASYGLHNYLSGSLNISKMRFAAYYNSIQNSGLNATQKQFLITELYSEYPLVNYCNGELLKGANDLTLAYNHIVNAVQFYNAGNYPAVHQQCSMAMDDIGSATVYLQGCAWAVSALEQHLDNMVTLLQSYGIFVQ